MQIDLSGKVAVVTGAAQGIGRAISLVFAEHGANIVALDIKTAEAKKVIEEISKFGRTSLAYKVDVSNSSEVNSAINQVIKEYGRIDIMVNNAGIYPESLVVDMASRKILSALHCYWPRITAAI
jgi:NAD(P)-dependent dehydrogenase (short-subunit alcohol dehydrogenase family)